MDQTTQTDERENKFHAATQGSSVRRWPASDISKIICASGIWIKIEGKAGINGRGNQTKKRSTKENGSQTETGTTEHRAREAGPSLPGKQAVSHAVGKEKPEAIRRPETAEKVTSTTSHVVNRHKGRKEAIRRPETAETVTSTTNHVVNSHEGKKEAIRRPEATETVKPTTSHVVNNHGKPPAARTNEMIQREIRMYDQLAREVTQEIRDLEESIRGKRPAIDSGLPGNWRLIPTFLPPVSFAYRCREDYVPIPMSARKRRLFDLFGGDISPDEEEPADLKASKKQGRVEVAGEMGRKKETEEGPQGSVTEERPTEGPAAASQGMPEL